MMAILSPRLVTIGGPPGSGTSTLGRALAAKTGWRYINAGQIFRQLAEEAGVDLAAFGRLAEDDPAIDRQLDARMVAEARANPALILEGRLTGWMARRHDLPAYAVWLEAPVAVRAARVGSRDGESTETARKRMARREDSERRRYCEHHGIDLGDTTIYDLKIDTAENDAEKVHTLVLAGLETEVRGGGGV